MSIDAAREPHEPYERPAARQVNSRRWLAVVLGSVAAIVSVVVGMMFFTGDRLPTIDQARLDAAKKLWNDRGPPSYDLEVSVQGIDLDTYQVAVRNGEVISAKINGTPLKQRRTLGSWSVPGMFRTISIDLERATNPIQVNVGHTHKVTPQGVFDSQYGYPVRYRRIEWGGDFEVSWVISKFEIVK